MNKLHKNLSQFDSPDAFVEHIEDYDILDQYYYLDEYVEFMNWFYDQYGIRLASKKDKERFV